jgi:regulatory protein
MAEDQGSVRARARRRTPTPAENRERRSAVEDPSEVLDAGARFLEARPRSVDEVRRKLSRLGYRAELVEAAIIRLSDLHYLDDDAFARAWVESRDRSRPRGEHALRRELELKGVDRAVVAAVLDDRRASAIGGEAPGPDAESPGPDDAAAERLLRRKLPAILREVDPRRRRQRAYALLARGGFSPDLCSAVSRRVLDGVAAVADAAVEGMADPGLEEMSDEDSDGG